MYEVALSELQFRLSLKLLKCVYFVVELTSRMQDCFFFSESEIKVVADLQKKWEMSDIMLSYLDTYWDVC